MSWEIEEELKHQKQEAKRWRAYTIGLIAEKCEECKQILKPVESATGAWAVTCYCETPHSYKEIK